MKRYIWAVIVSNVFDIVVSIVATSVVGIVILVLIGGNASSLTSNSFIYWFLVFIGALVSVAAGYLAARIAKSRYLLMGALSSVLCVCEGVVEIASSGATFENIVLLIITPVLGIAGGYIYLLRHK